MTKEQYKKYDKIQEELRPVKWFLNWCGDRYKDKSVSKYRFRIITKRYWRDTAEHGHMAVYSTSVLFLENGLQRTGLSINSLRITRKIISLTGSGLRIIRLRMQ